MKDVGPQAFILDAAYWEALYFREPCLGPSLALPLPIRLRNLGAVCRVYSELVRPFWAKPHGTGTLDFLPKWQEASSRAHGVLSPGLSPKGDLPPEHVSAGVAKGQLFVEVWVGLRLQAG